MSAESKLSAKAITAQARKEVEQENQAKAVELLKKKLRELDTARTVVGNIEREIADLELKIEHGNI